MAKKTTNTVKQKAEELISEIVLPSKKTVTETPTSVITSEEIIPLKDKEKDWLVEQIDQISEENAKLKLDILHYKTKLKDLYNDMNNNFNGKNPENMPYTRMELSYLIPLLSQLFPFVDDKEKMLE